MRPILWFAIYSSRREAEICRILAEDNREDSVVRNGVIITKRTGLVRDAKHPREKIGNHRRFVYRDEAWRIMQMQPESADGRIFPYDSKSVGARFTRACQIIGIEDLRFHDLRHEATSRLFELGMDIPEVATHTLHSSWTELKRYAQLDRLPAVYECPFLPVSEKTNVKTASAPTQSVTNVRYQRPE
jgi:integrase